MRSDPHTSRTFAASALLLLTLLPCSAEARTRQDARDAPQATDATEVVTQAQLEEWTAAILRDIESLRGKTFPRPVAVSVSDAEKLREYVRERTDKSTTPERRAADETLAKMLGCVPPDMDYEATLMALIDAQVGGFYDPDEEGFYLMAQFGGFLARTILSHELTHALDDQLYDIDGTLERLDGNSDAQFAYQAVVEGSGTAVMNAWQMQHMSEVDPKELLEMAQNQPGGDSLEEALPYLWKPLLAVYLKGAAFLKRTESVLGGQMGLPKLADFHAAFRSPPRSSEQVLHPEKYWSVDGRDEPVAVIFEFGTLPDGWSVLHDDTLGEFGVGLVVEPLDARGGVKGPMAPIQAKYTYPAAAGWGGDRYALLSDGAAHVVVWSTTWDSASDASEFVAAIEELRPHLTGSLARLDQLAGGDGARTGLALLRDGEQRVRLAAWFGTPSETVDALLDACPARFVPE